MADRLLLMLSIKSSRIGIVFMAVCIYKTPMPKSFMQYAGQPGLFHELIWPLSEVY